MASSRTYPQVLVTKEKHGTYYYLIQSDESLSRTLATLLRERYAAGFYYEPTPPKREAQEVAQVKELATTDPATLPEALRATVAEAARKLKRWAREDRIYQQDLEEWNCLKLVAEAPTLTEAAKLSDEAFGNYASFVMTSHNSYEYEGWELVPFQEVPED